MSTQNSSNETAKGTSTTNAAPAADKANMTVAKSNENNNTPADVAEDKKPRVVKTTDDKVAELRGSIISHFGISDEQLNKHVIAKLANSSKRTNLVDFYKAMIIDLVTKPELVAKIAA